jgi:hypothetical protein
VRDTWGNRVPSATVTINRSGTGTTLLSTKTTDTNGIANFLESMSIGTVGDYTLTARVSTGTNHPTTGEPISVVNDLEACDNQSCDNNTGNGQTNKLQKAFGQITTTTAHDFFDAADNVRLSTQFVPGALTNQCGNSTIGDATDLTIAGPGTAATVPATVMVLIMPKDSLKAYNITARGVDSFNVCLGALNISGGSVTPWMAKSAGKKGTIVPSVPGVGGRYWGIVADCFTPQVGTADPCIGIRTKQALTAKNYLATKGITATQFTAMGIKDSDLVVVINKSSPWDGRGGLY